MFYFFIKVHKKCIISRFFKHTILLIMSIKDILNSKTFKYPYYKKVFLDENLKTRFSDMKKLQKATQI